MCCCLLLFGLCLLLFVCCVCVVFICYGFCVSLVVWFILLFVFVVLFLSASYAFVCFFVYCWFQVALATSHGRCHIQAIFARSYKVLRAPEVLGEILDFRGAAYTFQSYPAIIHVMDAASLSECNLTF